MSTNCRGTWLLVLRIFCFSFNFRSLKDDSKTVLDYLKLKQEKDDMEEIIDELGIV